MADVGPSDFPPGYIPGALTLGGNIVGITGNTIFSYQLGTGWLKLGDSAGQSLTIGSSETTLVGNIAGQYLTAGFNTAVGEHALGYEVGAVLNCAFGNDTMRNYIGVTTTGGNSAFGRSALHLGGGYQNTGLGQYALFGCSGGLLISGTPTANEVISYTYTCASGALYAGAMAGSTHTVVYNVGATPTVANVAVGLAAAVNADATLAVLGINCGVVDNQYLFDLTIGTQNSGQMITRTASTTGTLVLTPNGGATGNNNIGIGYEGLYGLYLTTGSFNIGIGNLSLYSLTTGSTNIGIGASAGKALTSGGNNVFIGNTAGGGITLANNSVAIGNGAASSASLSSTIVAIGSFAAQYHLGNNTVAIGPNALQGVNGGTSIGAVNTAVGYQAGENVTSANTSVFLGAQAGQNVTSGGGQVFIGYLSGQNSIASDKNTFVGYSSGISVTGFQNTFMGYQSGTHVTSGANNVIIGYNNAAATLNTGNTNILIGVNLDTSAGNTSNTINIGNVFLATGSGTPATSQASVAGTFNTLVTAVSGLPAAGTVGRRAFVTDALAPVFGSAVVGSGAVKVPVYDTGAAWFVG